jgi:HTH-type transcriptional regulator, transcriptional repressor of NAD biosynthesis genes
MTRGFLLGKFMPPHAGHVALCRAGMAQCDRLTVLVCSRDVEPVPGGLRAGVLAELLPGARVLRLHREIPQEPAEHPDFWRIWRETIRTLHPAPIDRVFGSEPYVIRLAAELGAEPVPVDPDRLAVPVSGTAVRQDPAGQWRWIPGPLRPWYQKRLVLVGPEGLGLPTLAARLADGAHVPDHGPATDRFRGDGPWTEDDILAAARRHLALRAAVAPLAGPVLVEETDPLVIAARARLLMGRPLARLEEGLRFADLYVLLDPDVPPADDGARHERGAGGLRFMDVFRALLDEAGTRHVFVAGSGAACEAAARAALSELAGEPFPGRWSGGPERHPVHALPLD